MNATLSFAALLLMSTSAWAAIPALDNLDKNDLDNVAKEFSSNFMHTTVSPAKSLGHVWGFEIGVVGGITQTPKLEALVHEVSPTTNVDKLPHGGLLAMLTVPYGITGEFTMIPEKTISEVTVKNLSLGVKWTITDVFPLPEIINEWLALAVRVHYSNSDLSYKQTINNYSTGNTNVDATIGFDSSVWGMNAVASSDILIFEPYVGLGFAKGKTDLKIDGTGTISIFGQNTEFSGANSASSSNTTAHMFGGVQFDLFLFHLAAEVSRAFDATSYTGKFSFYF